MDLTTVFQSYPGQLNPTGISVPPESVDSGGEVDHTRFEMCLSEVTLNVYAHAVKKEKLTLLRSDYKLPTKFVNDPVTLLTLINTLNESNVVMHSYFNLTSMTLIMEGVVPDDVKDESCKAFVHHYISEVVASMDRIRGASLATGDSDANVVFMSSAVHGKMKEVVDRLLGEGSFDQVAKSINIDAVTRGPIQ